MIGIKVLVVDDSAVIRQIIKEILLQDEEIEAVEVASDPIFAEKKIMRFHPDVVTLDIEMPNMDGITFLERLMGTNPVPVIMISAHTDRQAKETIRALELGAIDFVTKPKKNVLDHIETLREEVVGKVKTAAKANIGRKRSSKPLPRKEKIVENILKKTNNGNCICTKKFDAQTGKIIDKEEKVIVLGASTGGTVAINRLLELMPIDCPGIAIVQHMPEKFTKAYADRINGLVSITVKEAENGDRIKNGLALIAPGGKHMLLQKDGRGFYVEVKDGPPVSGHKPSVDVLFRSAANSAGSKAIGIILTGMGSDGAQGMLELKKAGAFNIAQNNESCVVFGMPKAAIEKNAVHRISTIEAMPDLILNQKSNSIKIS